MKVNDKKSKKTMPRLLNIGSVSGMLMRSVLVAICGIVLMSASEAGAVLIDLDPFNVDESFDKSKVDIYVDVTENDEQVRFEFHNDSDLISSIKSIFFEDGVLDGIAGFEFGFFTLFAESKKAGNLPGGNSLSNDFETAYSAYAIPPAPFTGIGHGEELTIIMDLDEGASFADLLGQLEDKSLRIGAHVIALPCGSSFSAVSNPSNPIPEPATILILGIGSLCLIRKKKSA